MRSSFFLAIALLFINHALYARISVIDDAGDTVTLKSSAKRIVSLSPGVTELIFAAGGGGYLKGVVNYSDYPEAAKKIPQIGSYNSIDIEQIIALSPDLVVAWKSGNPPLQISQLKKLGVNVYQSEPREFEDIPSTISRLGLLMDTAPIADKSSASFRKRLTALQQRYPKTANKKTVFIQIWNQPLMTISGKHLISKVVSQCNGKNIFQDESQLTLSLNVETIINMNPDIILVTRQGKLGEAWLSQWRRWGFLTSVSQHQLYRVNPDIVVRHTPRILDGIAQVCSFLYSK